jgi:hypothetical protein
VLSEFIRNYEYQSITEGFKGEAVAETVVSFKDRGCLIKESRKIQQVKIRILFIGNEDLFNVYYVLDTIKYLI